MQNLGTDSFPNLDPNSVTRSEIADDHGDVDQVTELQQSSSNIEDVSPVPAVTASFGERLSAGWAATRAALGSLLGLVPHVLHHVGIVAGTALLAGVWGNLALYVVGLLLSIPMLRRLHRRFNSIVAPIAGATIFTLLFLISAFVIGPAINPGPEPPVAPTVTQSPALDSEHEGHHPLRRRPSDRVGCGHRDRPSHPAGEPSHHPYDISTAG